MHDASVLVVADPSSDIKAEDRPFELLDWGLVTSVSLIWGASFLFIAYGLETFEPGLVAFLRTAFGAVTVALFPGSRGAVPRAEMPRIALLGFTWLAFPFTMFALAQQWIDSSVAGMLVSAMPLMTLAIAWAVFSTPTGPRRLIGILIGLGGVLLIGLPEAATGDANALGVVLVLLAATSYGVAANIAGPLQREYGSLPVISRALMFAIAFSLPFGLVGAVGSSFSWPSLLGCIAVGVGGTGIAYTLATTLAGRVGAVRVSIVTYVVPVVAVTLGVVFRDEVVSVWALVGTAVVLSGAYLSSRLN